jgi:3',5'-cyclic AMP phosphodiesterase CpdA
MKPDILQFGVIADCQYDAFCDESNLPGNRYCVTTLDKLQNAVDELNQHDLDFVVNVGDLIDQRFENFPAPLKVLSGSRAPVYHLVGNHDFCGPGHEYGLRPREDVFNAIGLKNPYYSWQQRGWKFIVLDTNEVGTIEWMPGTREYAEGAKVLSEMKEAGANNARPWNGGLSEMQFAWLEKELQTELPVIVFGHHPISPDYGGNCLNYERVRDVLQKAPQVQAYFCGHEHAGMFDVFVDLPCLAFKGMVETKDETCFAIVTLDQEKIEIQGFGREESRVLDRRNF